MRLLEIGERGELTLTKDLKANIPTYAILSHTWGAEDEEVEFNDLKTGIGKDKQGYSKIQFCQEQARSEGIHSFWVDTCCIDKSSSTELATAIASMYQWYRNAAKCYVFLSDVLTSKRDNEGSKKSWELAFRKSRWFMRGWTLQELLAPKSVDFFSREGVRLGDKGTLEKMIHEITSIPIEALRGAPLHQFPVAERVRWQEQRQVTIEEDRAYCLLGIFDVFMHPLYGEGKHAFERLMDEITRSFRKQLDLAGKLNVTAAPYISQTSGPDSAFNNIEGTASYERTKTLLSSLSFPEMDSRRSTIESAYTTTCQWLLKHPAYIDWNDSKKLEQHCGFLWINGKPGAGKSTLMKFAHACADRERPDGEILISYFFNARGEELEKTTIGMYRALLFQLLERATELQELLHDSYFPSKHQSQPPIWTIKSLCELLLASMTKLRSRRLKCFIDALDECDEQQIREMIDFFDSLGQMARLNGTELYICFSSRHYPAIDIKNGERLNLEDEIGHTEDLAKYIRSHLRAGKGKYIEAVRMEIQNKANSVFMWAVLVINILNKEFRDGRIFAVKKRLQEIPLELSDLFKDILRRDSTNMTDLLLCLQWILYAKRPLKPEEYYFAMVCGLDPEPENIAEWDPDHVTSDCMRKFVLTSSKGLAELTKSKVPIVQFIHESVRDFLVKDNGLCELWPELAGKLHTSAHNRLKQCCQIYMNVDLSGHVSFGEVLPKASSQSAKDLRQTLNAKYPFIQYASQHILYHADEAATEIPQDDFLRDFELNIWIRVTNVLEQHEVRRYTTNMSLLYVLAEKNYVRLIKIANRNGFAAWVRGERYQYPLFAALANSHQDAVRALLHQDAEPLIGDIAASLKYGQAFSFRKEHTPLSWALANDHRVLAEFLVAHEDYDVNMKDGKGRTPLWWAAAKGYEIVVKLLLQAGTVNVNAKDKNNQTPLLRAAREGHDAVVKLLLETGNVEVNIKGFHSRTPLLYAAIEGHDAVVKLLLKTGNVEVNMKDIYGQTPLSCAAREGHYAVVKLLLETGNVEVDMKDSSSRTPLSWAAGEGHDAVVKLLLQTGNVEVNMKDSCGQTPLLRATERGHDAVVKLLLETGNVEVNMKDSCGQTPLLRATERGHDAVVKLLLETGNVEVNMKGIYGRTPLWWAAGKGQDAVVKLLLQTGNVEVNMKDSCGQTPLLRATERGHDAVVKLLLETGNVDVDMKDFNGQTPLSWAARKGHDAVVKLLLETSNVEVNTKDNSGRTPLWWATAGGHEAITKLLLKADKVDVDVKDKDNLTPLSRAAEDGYDAVVKLLLETGKVDVNAKDTNNLTPLSRAAEKGHETVMKLLLATDEVNVNTKDKDGQTPLLWVAWWGHEAVVKLLLKTNAVNIDAQDCSGRTPLSRAAEKGHEAVVKLLLQTSRVDVNAKDYDDLTPLFRAAEKGHEAVVKLFLEKGKANVDVKDSNGRTPLLWVARWGQEATVKLLLETSEVNVDTKDNLGRTPLSWAAEGGHETVVQLLLETGQVDVNRQDHAGQTPRSRAAGQGNETVVRLLELHQS